MGFHQEHRITMGRFVSYGIGVLVIVVVLCLCLWYGGGSPQSQMFEEISRGDFQGAHGRAMALSDQKNPEADYVLGWFNRQGWQGPVDPQRAAYYFQRAQQGFQQMVQDRKEPEKAAFYLGVLAELGLTASPDRMLAMRWYQTAADRGDSYAQLNLGNLHLGSQDTLAASWFRKAAEGGGDPKAMINLGCLLAEGRGTPENDQEALTWFQRANVRVRGLARTHIMAIKDPEPMTQQMLSMEDGHVFHHIIDDTAVMGLRGGP